MDRRTEEDHTRDPVLIVLREAMPGSGHVPSPSELSVEVQNQRQVASRDLGMLALLALALVLLHTLTNGLYPFYRDELATLDDARHLAWGYVVYPPMTPFLGRLALELFGASPTGLRLFSALAQALVLLLTGLTAREIGGRRPAQLVAAFAAAIAPPALFTGGFVSYTSFDYLWWITVAYFVVRLLRSDDPRWWVAIGAAIGAGMMTKYTMIYLVAGVVAGVLLTPARRYLRSPWLWCGAVIAALVWSPNLVWLIQHHFVSLDYLKSIHARDVRWGRADYFLLNQFWRCTNVVTVPLWGAGFWYLFATRDGKRYRPLGWMYVVPLVAFLASRAREYYLAPAYPMLLAAGAVWGERWTRTLSARAAATVRGTAWQSIAVSGLLTAAVILPLAPVGSGWWRLADSINGNFGYSVGYREMVETVARIRDSLPAAQRPRIGVLAGDDGEAGAVDLYGPAYGLPRAIGGMNTYWFRGYGDPPPETVIVVGMSRSFVDRSFASCEVAGRLANRYGVVNHAIAGYEDVFVCRQLRQSWPEFWKHFQYYG